MPPAKKILRVLTILLAVGIAFVAGLRVKLFQAERSAAVVKNATPPDPIPAFSLTERSGKTITQKDLQGGVWLADFIFTRCAGPCPLMSSRMSALATDFKKEKDLRFVSFTVDPAHDTPAILRKYADLYMADKDQWLFLTGDKKKIFALIKDGFRLGVAGDQDPDSILHSTYFVLMDKDARIAGYYNSEVEADMGELKKKIRKLL